MKITLTLTDCTLEEAQAVLSFNRTPDALVEFEPVEDVPPFEDSELQTDEDAEPEQSFDTDALEEVLQEETDANGHVWDPALHSSSKAKTNKGFWKMRRGNTTEKVDVAMPGMPLPPIPPAPPIQTMSMANVVEKITAGITSQSISITDVSAALVDLKLANLVDLGAHPGLFEPFLKRLGL